VKSIRFWWNFVCQSKPRQYLKSCDQNSKLVNSRWRTDAIQCWVDHRNSQQKATWFERTTADCARSSDLRRRSALSVATSERNQTDHPPVAMDCYIATNNGTLCRLQVKCRCWRQTDRWTLTLFKAACTLCGGGGWLDEMYTRCLCQTFWLTTTSNSQGYRLLDLVTTLSRWETPSFLVNQLSVIGYPTSLQLYGS